jgi:hypothetical protein
MVRYAFPVRLFHPLLQAGLSRRFRRGPGRLLRRQEARAGLAFDGAGEAEVGAMPCLGVLGAGAAWFVALDGTLGHGATAHRFRFRQLASKLANVRGR